MKASAPLRSPAAARWLLCLGLSVAFGMLACGALIIFDARQDSWRQAEQSLNNLRLILERDISRNIAVFDLSLQGTVEALAEPGIDQASPALRRQALFDRAASAEELGSILVLNAAGDIVEDSSAAVPHKVNLSDRAYFRVHQDRADAGLYVSRPFQSRLREGELCIALSRRLPTADGHFAGIVIGAMRLNFFRHLFENLDLGAKGTVTLLHTDGHIITRQPFHETDVGRDLTEGEGYRHMNGVARGEYVSVAVTDHVERLYAFQRLDNLPLIISVGLATDDIFAAWRQKAINIGSVLAVLCTATVAMCVLFYRELLRRAAAESALSAANGKLAVIAATDALTGLPNRRAFDTAIETEWKRAIRVRSSLSLLMVDVDSFKLYNDRYGHPEGDRVLKAVAGCIEGSIGRPDDLAARYGGEEFMVLLPATNSAGASFVAGRIRADVEALRISQPERPAGRLTVSIGVATLQPAGGDTESLVRMVDEALYEAKRGGRNRIAVAAAPETVAASERSDQPLTV